MSTYLDNYRKRVSLGATDRRGKLISQAEKTFERQLIESPSSKRLKATIPGQIDVIGNANEIDCILLNISDNDIKAADQKYLLTRKNENFDIGCYVEFDGTYWLAAFKEHRTLDTHMKFTLYKCNNIWRYKVNGTIYEFPIYIQNLSLYSDGLADNKYTSMEDGKVSMFYGENPITKKAKVNTRIAISNRLTFRMTNINDYEFRSTPFTQCAIKAMLLQTTVLDKDDMDNNVAWNSESETNDIVEGDTPKIVGDSVAMLGSKKIYDSSIELNYKHWELECDSELKKYIQFNTPGLGNQNCEIRFPSNVKFSGDSVFLKLFSSNVLVDTMEIKIRGL